MKHLLLAILIAFSASLYSQQGLIQVKDKDLKKELKTLKNDTITLTDAIYINSPMFPYKVAEEKIIVKTKDGKKYIKLSMNQWYMIPNKAYNCSE